MKVENIRVDEIDEVFRLYDIASAYQKSKKTVVVWPDFDREMVSSEIDEQRQFKLVIDNEIACIWAITFSDAQIWRERNADPAIYIHRIATNPKFRGLNFVELIVDWAKDSAKTQTKQFIRLDTIGDNTRLINHYCNCGFDFLGMFDLPNVDELPPHYKEGPVCLFEIDIKKLRMTPRIVELKSKQLLGIYQEMSLIDNKTFELWKNFRPRSKEILNKSSQDFISLQVYPKGYFETFSPATKFVKWASVEVDDFDQIPAEMDSLVLNGGLYAVFNYKGNAENAPVFFQYIYGEWIPKSVYNLDDRPHFELLGDKYKNNDPASEEEIWIPIKAK